MARLGSPTAKARQRHRIAVIDDDADLRDSLARLLASEGHEVRTAATAADGVELVRSFTPDLVLLDYLLERETGAVVVRGIRSFDRLVQVILVTGYATEHPARTMLAELEINGYHDKGDGPQRLLVLVDAALKQARALARLERQRRNLRHLIDALPSIVAVQSSEDLLRNALDQAARLLNVASGIIATSNSGLFVMSDPVKTTVSVRASMGAYQGAHTLADLPPEVREGVRRGLELDRPTALPEQLVVIPMTTRDGDRGAIVVAAPQLAEDAAEVCELFAQQVTLAFENQLLFDRSTVDPLTLLYNRGYGEERLVQTLRLGRRTGTSSAVILVDIDHFKRINDRYGHAAGDLALRRFASALKAAVRTSDVVVRWGGEEFLLVLPATDLIGARTLAERLRLSLRDLAIDIDGATLRLTASLGVAGSAPEGLSAAALVGRADRALYRAKAAGRDRVDADDGSAMGGGLEGAVALRA